MISRLRLIGVCKTTHTTHDTKDIVVGSVDTNLGSGRLHRQWRWWKGQAEE